MKNQLVYEPSPSNNYDFSCFDQPPQYHIDQSPPQDLVFDSLMHSDTENNRISEEILRTLEANSLVDVKEPKGSDDYMEVTYDKEQCLSDHYTAHVTTPAYTPSIPFLATMEHTNTLLMVDEVISTIPVRETNEFIKSSVDDLVPITKESEVTSDSNLECDMPATTPLPPTDVREEYFDINSPLGEYVVDFLMKNVDVAGLPRHLVNQLFNHLIKNPSLTKEMSNEPLGDDSKPIPYVVTFSNPLFDFNDDFTLCNDNPLFDEEFEDISSLDLPELTLVIDESTLLVTLALPCTDVLRDSIVDIDLLLGEQLDTLSIGHKEIDINPSRDIEELERLLADDHIRVPGVFDEPLSNSDSMSRSSKTSDLFEELIDEFGLDDSIPTEIDDRCHDSEGDILYFEQFLNEDTSSDVSPSLLPTESSSLVTLLPNPKKICLREVERFGPFFSLTRSRGTTRVMETPSFGFYHMSSPRLAAYSPKEVMYRFYLPHQHRVINLTMKVKVLVFACRIPSDHEDLRACFRSSNLSVQKVENEATTTIFEYYLKTFTCFSSVGSGNEFVYEPNPYSYNETPDFFNQPLQHQYETYSCELCGDSPHYGFDCQTRTPLVYEQDTCNNQNFSNDQSLYYSTSLPQQFDCCEVCGGPHYSFDCQAGNTPIYDQGPCYNQNFNDDQHLFYSSNQQQQFDCCEEILRALEANSPVDVKEPKGSDDYTEVTYDKEQCLSDHYTAPVTPHAYTPSIPFLATMKPTYTLLMGDEIVMPATTPLPLIDVRDEDSDINSPLGEYVVDFLMKNMDVAGLPRHLVKQLFNHLIKNPSLTKRMFDEPLGDDSKPTSYDVTFSNPLFDFNDDFILCNDNPIFDEEFEDISSLDLPELTPVIDEPTLLVTLPLPKNNWLDHRDTMRKKGLAFESESNKLSSAHKNSISSKEFGYDSVASLTLSIRKSEYPRELEPVDRRSSVHVNLIRRDENYLVIWFDCDYGLRLCNLVIGCFGDSCGITMGFPGFDEICRFNESDENSLILYIVLDNCYMIATWISMVIQLQMRAVKGLRRSLLFSWFGD
nr:hypothetical protein [Tanacetum cinerariifolium]